MRGQVVHVKSGGKQARGGMSRPAAAQPCGVAHTEEPDLSQQFYRARRKLLVSFTSSDSCNHFDLKLDCKAIPSTDKLP